MTNSLEIENEQRLRVLRLNRPERKNALNSELLRPSRTRFAMLRTTKTSGLSH